MPRMTMIEAIRDAMDVMMERDDNVVVFGEDVGYFGGVFRCTAGPAGRNTARPAASTRRSAKPASSAPPSAWRPTACGPASRSSSPTTCIRPTTRSCPRRRGCATARTATSPARSWCACRPAAASSAARRTARARKRCSPTCRGLKTVVPSNPYDAKGLLIAAIEDPRPGDLPRAEAALQRPVRRPSRPAGHAVVEACAGRGAGAATTRVPLGKAVDRARRARPSPCWPTARWSMSRRRRPRRPASTPRSSTCARCCRSTSRRSSHRSRRPAAASSCTRRRCTSGFGAELSALVQEHCFYHLEAPVERVTGWDTPYPHAQEWDYFPGPARVGRALVETMEA